MDYTENVKQGKTKSLLSFQTKTNTFGDEIRLQGRQNMKLTSHHQQHKQHMSLLVQPHPHNNGH